MEEQNSKIAKSYEIDMRKLETLFRNDAQQQVEAYKQNAMADYKELWELWELREQNQYLSSANQFLKDELTNRVSAFRETSATFVEQSDIKAKQVLDAEGNLQSSVET